MIGAPPRPTPAAALDPAAALGRETPAWASWLGVVAVVLGVLLTGHHAAEWLKHAIIVPIAAPGETPPDLDCRPDELAEEGLSVLECEAMARRIEDIVASRPDWYRGFHITLAAAGTLVAFASIFVGVALVEYRRWAPAAAVGTFGLLTALDAIGFAGAVNTGPILREMYLWPILLWFFLHLLMTVGAVAGYHGSRSA